MRCEMALQDQLCGDGVKVPPCAATVVAGGTQSILGVDRGKTLLGKIDAQAEAAAQLVGETSAVRGHGGCRAV